MEYTVVVEPAGDNYSAYVPDLPGCVATGASVEDVRREIAAAMSFHIEGLQEAGLPVPPPRTVAVAVLVGA
jgi:predicted RNase H-like HicB family nuclease